MFVVGQDAALKKNREALRMIAAAGHEIGNHSFRHEPWFHLYSEDEIDGELAELRTRLEELEGKKLGDPVNRPTQVGNSNPFS